MQWPHLQQAFKSTTYNKQKYFDCDLIATEPFHHVIKQCRYFHQACLHVFVVVVSAFLLPQYFVLIFGVSHHCIRWSMDRNTLKKFSMDLRLL